ncbi:ATP-binding cassette domain-containing protein [Corynebacterium urogenitale]
MDETHDISESPEARADVEIELDNAVSAEAEARTDKETEEQPAAAISAHGLTLHTRQGAVFHDVDLEIPAGSIHALVGPQGSGRSSLLLVLAGRMKFSEGELTVDGTPVKHGPFAQLLGKLGTVQNATAIAGFRDIDDLDTSTKVGEIVNELLGLTSPLLRRAETWHAPRVKALRELIIPGLEPKTWVRNLSAYEDFAMRITMAMLSEPRILLVDNVDQLSAPEDQRTAWEMLRRIQETGVTVVASTTNTETLPEDIPRTVTHRPVTHRPKEEKETR